MLREDKHCTFNYSFIGNAGHFVLFGWGQSSLIEQIPEKLLQNAIWVVSHSFLQIDETVQSTSEYLRLRTNVAKCPEELLVISHGEPRASIIDQTLANLRAFFTRRGSKPSLVLALGGGSCLDFAKILACLWHENGSSIDYAEHVGSRTLSGKSLPLWAIPMTMGTGSEATMNAVLETSFDGARRKVSIRHEALLPRLALLDPSLCIDLPWNILWPSAVDAFVQLLESSVSVAATSRVAQLARSSLALVLPALIYLSGHEELTKELYAGEAIPELPQSRADACADLLMAAHLSGECLRQAGLGLVHGLAGTLGSLWSMGHGLVCAHLLQPCVYASIVWLQTHAPDDLSRYEDSGRALELGGESGIDDLKRAIAVLLSLGERILIDKPPRILNDSELSFVLRCATNKNSPAVLDTPAIEQLLGSVMAHK